MRRSRVAALLLVFVAPFALGANSGILTYEEYAQVEHDVPFITEYRSNQGKLVVVGVQHTNRSDSPIMPLLFSEWRQANPTVAFHEGTRWGIGNDPDDTVRRFGEPGVVRFLAISSRTPVTSLEPDMVDEIRHLVHDGWNPAQVALFYTLRPVAEAKQRGGGDAAPTESASTFLNSGFPQMPEMEGRPRSLDELQAAFAEHFGGLRDWSMVEADWFDPMQSHHFTNEMARASGQFRDEYMVERFVDRVKRGESVFVVVGYYHAVMIEPELARRLGTPVRVIGRNQADAQ